MDTLNTTQGKAMGSKPPISPLSSESLTEVNHDALIRALKKCVVVCVKCLAVLMVVVIWMAFLDVLIHLYQQIINPPFLLFSVEGLIATLGDFLAVLIAIEIFLNLLFYLSKDANNVPLVLSTALTAVARKVIIFEYKTIDSHQIYATAAVIFAIRITYWLVSKKSD